MKQNQPTKTPTKATKPPCQVIVMRNKLFYITCWNYMRFNNKLTCVDASGQTQYREEVRNILANKYKYTLTR